MLTRRKFGKNVLAGSAALLASGNSWAVGEPPASPGQLPPQQKMNVINKQKWVYGIPYDVLIKGGTVVDPSQHLHEVLDVAVKNGKISQIAKDIPVIEGCESQAEVLSAKGKIVTPGFIDFHCHVFDGQGYTLYRNPDHYQRCRGVTTCLDFGSSSHGTIGQMVKYVIKSSDMRVRCLVHLGMMANAGTIELFHRFRYGPDMDWVNPELTEKAAEENKPYVVGIKVHLDKPSIRTAEQEEWVFQRGLEVAKATNLPLMMHATELHRPLVGYLKRLRKGDVFTHCFHMYYSEDIDSHIFLPNGKIKPEAIEARQRGVIFDTANANSSINFEFNEKAMQQGFLPDSISTNFTLGIEGDRIYDLPTTVSRYLAMGMDLDTAVKLVTVNPSHQADFGQELGTLRPGTTADISVWDLREGNFEFTDGWKQKRMGHQMLVNKFVLTSGRVWSNYMGNYPKDTPWTYTGSTG